jgi:putative membrane protein insertion efficiency factor
MKSTLIYIVKFYQIFLSLFLGRNKCRFYPTCSNYFIESVKKKGCIIGIYYALIRIAKCNPFSRKFGYDPVK